MIKNLLSRELSSNESVDEIARQIREVGTEPVLTILFVSSLYDLEVIEKKIK